MTGLVPYLDLAPEERADLHRWLGDHGVDHHRVPVYAEFGHDAATDEWRIPLFWQDADGRMRLTADGDVRKVVVRRRELRPLPWPEKACEFCCTSDCEGDCDELYDCLSSLECPCGGDCWDDLPPERPVETVTVAGGLL